MDDSFIKTHQLQGTLKRRKENEMERKDKWRGWTGGPRKESAVVVV